MKNLNSSANLSDGPLLAVSHRTEAVKLTAHASADTDLAPLTPIAFDTATGKYVVYANGAANSGNRIVGFVWPDLQVQTTASDPTVTIMVEGEIYDYSKIPTNGASASNFLADFHASKLREKNITVKKVSGFFRN